MQYSSSLIGTCVCIFHCKCVCISMCSSISIFYSTLDILENIDINIYEGILEDIEIDILKDILGKKINVFSRFETFSCFFDEMSISSKY